MRCGWCAFRLEKLAGHKVQTPRRTVASAEEHSILVNLQNGEWPIRNDVVLHRRVCFAGRLRSAGIQRMLLDPYESDVARVVRRTCPDHVIHVISNYGGDVNEASVIKRPHRDVWENPRLDKCIGAMRWN